MAARPPARAFDFRGCPRMRASLQPRSQDTEAGASGRIGRVGRTGPWMPDINVVQTSFAPSVSRLMVGCSARPGSARTLPGLSEGDPSVKKCLTAVRNFINNEDGPTAVEYA